MVSGRRPGVLLAAAGLLVLCAPILRNTGRSVASFVGGSVKTVSRRGPKVQRMGVDNAMKDRIAGIQKTGKLTDAMRLVAAAKVRRAQEGVERSRPFSEELTGMIKGIVKKLKGSGLEQELPMLRTPEKVNNVGIVLVQSNRGLCGAYNTFIAKRAITRIEELNELGITPKIIAVGKKAITALDTRIKNSGTKYNYTGAFFDFPETPNAENVNAVGEAIRNLFLSGEVDKVELIYAKFINLLSNVASVRTMLPLTPTGIESPEDETFRVTTEEGQFKVEKEKRASPKAKDIEADVIFDQAPEQILNSMLPLYLNSKLMSLFFEAQASELGSRMVAMKAATDNAEDLAKRLTLVFNKKRQAAITQELCEICAGALAQETGDDDAGVGPGLGLWDNAETVPKELMEEIESGSISDELTDPSLTMNPETDDFVPGGKGFPDLL